MRGQIPADPRRSPQWYRAAGRSSLGFADVYLAIQQLVPLIHPSLGLARSRFASLFIGSRSLVRGRSSRMGATQPAGRSGSLRLAKLCDDCRVISAGDAGQRNDDLLYARMRHDNMSSPTNLYSQKAKNLRQSADNGCDFCGLLWEGSIWESPEFGPQELVVLSRVLSAAGSPTDYRITLSYTVSSGVIILSAFCYTGSNVYSSRFLLSGLYGMRTSSFISRGTEKGSESLICCRLRS
jgi:hypothetical protein